MQQNRKPFTMIPNSIIDELSLEELGIYIMVKKHAGAQGESWVSNKTIEKKFKIDHRKVKAIYASLEKKGLVVCVGDRKASTKGGYQPIKVYKIVKGGYKSTYLSTKGVGTPPPPVSKGWKNEAKGVGVHPMNKIPINKIDTSLIENTEDTASEERIRKYKEVRLSLAKKMGIL